MRPAILVAVLLPLHVATQQLLLGHVVPALLLLPLLAVAAFEAADRAAERYATRKTGAERPL